MGEWRSEWSDEQAQQSVDALGGAPGGQAAQLGDHGQILEAAQVRVEMRLFGHVAHALLVGDQVAANGLAAEKDFARADLDQPGDHFHGGGFAGAVGAQVAGDFARWGGEADVIYGEDAGETLGDVAQFERHHFTLFDTVPVHVVPGGKCNGGSQEISLHADRPFAAP